MTYFTCAGRLREANSIVFYVSGRLWQAWVGGSYSNRLKGPGGPPEDRITRGISTLGELWELGELWARCGSSGSWNRRSGRGLGALGAGFVVPGEVWEGQILTTLSQLKRPGGSPKEPLTRGISILGAI